MRIFTAANRGTSLLKNYFSTLSNSRVIYSNAAVNKLIVSRTPDTPFSIYLEYDATIADFRDKIQLCYPEINIGLSNKVMGIGTVVDSGEQLSNFQSMKDLPLVDSLILNNLFVYETSDKGVVQLLYGVQMIEHNLTNRTNIPQYIEEGVTELNAEWSHQMTIEDALSFDNIRKLEDGPLNKQTGQEISSQLSQEEQQAFKQSVESMIMIDKFKNQHGVSFGTSRELLYKIIGLMSANWVFLFAITYGRYGWDVGEPVSYLTSLTVDLIAMMGIFQAGEALVERKKKDIELISYQTNLDAAYRMAQWRIGYLSRKTIF